MGATRNDGMDAMGSAKSNGASALKARNDIELKDRWATETMFSTKADWEAEFAAIESKVKDMERFRGTLGNGAEALLAFAKYRDDTEARLDRIFVYASMLSDEDTRVGETQAMESRARSLAISYSQATSWVEPELTAISREELDAWMGNTFGNWLYMSTRLQTYFDRSSLFSRLARKS